MKKFVIGISGASGIILAYKLMLALLEQDHSIELVVSKNAQYAASLELKEKYGVPDEFMKSLSEDHKAKIHAHSIGDVGCSIASGSFPTDGMIIIPCSMATIAAVSIGLADNALRRAADVTIKEKRSLIIVPRESPFSEIHLENLLKLARLGATIIPPIPAWYTHPTSVDDIENFIVGRVLDCLKIPHQLYPRWKTS